LLAGSIWWVLESILIKVSRKDRRTYFIYTTGFWWTLRPDYVQMELLIIHVYLLLERDKWTYRPIEAAQNGRMNGFTSEWWD